MATTIEHQTEPAGDTAPRRRLISPQAIALGVGIAFAVITVGSGIAGAVFDFHDESPVSRHVFGNIPDAWEVAFYSVLPVLLVYGAYNFSLRVRNWQRGGPDRRATTRDNVGRRLR